MFKFLKKDSFWLGVLLGIVLPAVVIGLLYLVFYVSPASIQNKQMAKIIVLGIVPNAFVMRYYLVNLKADHTGRGILFVTFILAIIFIIYNFI
jgi:hypothetical protein